MLVNLQVYRFALYICRGLCLHVVILNMRKPEFSLIKLLKMHNV